MAPIGAAALPCSNAALATARLDVAPSFLSGNRLVLKAPCFPSVTVQSSALSVRAVAVAEPVASTPLAGLLTGTDPAWKLGSAEKSRLKEYYDTAVSPALKAEFDYKNVLEIPRIEKVVINCGIGDASQSAKTLETASKDLAAVTGQRPVVTRSRKAIAGFKLRAGVPVGMAVTLRGQVMYAYLDRLMNLALPRMRDFQGVSRGGFDGRGNYSMGIPEQTVFPEIRFEDVDKARGMDISIVTSAKNDREAQRLLELLGMPFKEGPAPVKERRTGKRGNFGKKGGSSNKPKAKKKK